MCVFISQDRSFQILISNSKLSDKMLKARRYQCLSAITRNQGEVISHQNSKFCATKPRQPSTSAHPAVIPHPLCILIPSRHQLPQRIPPSDTSIRRAPGQPRLQPIEGRIVEPHLPHFVPESTPPGPMSPQIPLAVRLAATPPTTPSHHAASDFLFRAAVVAYISTQQPRSARDF